MRVTCSSVSSSTLHLNSVPMSSLKFSSHWLVILASLIISSLLYVTMNNRTLLSLVSYRTRATDLEPMDYRPNEYVTLGKPRTRTKGSELEPTKSATAGKSVGLLETQNDLGYDLSNINFFSPAPPENTSTATITHQFVPVEGAGVRTIHDLCIEETVTDTGKEKILVAYNAPKNMEGTQLLKPYISANSRIKSWKVLFRSDPIPETHRIIKSHPAFFISPSCPGNLYHFWADSTVQLYGTLKATQRLNVSAQPEGNQVFYPLSFRNLARANLDGKNCNDPTRFQDILFTLGVRQWHGWYGYAPRNICYTNSVFGFVDASPKGAEAEEFVMNAMGYSKKSCPLQPTVTILQRKTRRILNAEKLMNVSKDAGFPNTAIHIFEDMPVPQQFKIASCSDILVGVQGAGLAWIYFMPRTSAVVEIAWPEKQWPPKYIDRARIRGMTAEAILNPTLFPNWEVYAKREGTGIPFTPEQKESLLHGGNLWKWADTEVPVEQFRAILFKLKSQLALY